MENSMYIAKYVSRQETVVKIPKKSFLLTCIIIIVKRFIVQMFYQPPRNGFPD